MSKELSAQVIATALGLAKKHKEKGVYVNVGTGHMNFKRNAAFKVSDAKVVVFVSVKGDVLSLDKDGNPILKKTSTEPIDLPEGTPTKEGWTVEQIKQYLTNNNVKFASNTGESKLLEKVAEFLKTAE